MFVYILIEYVGSVYLRLYCLGGWGRVLLSSYLVSLRLFKVIKWGFFLKIWKCILYIRFK